MGSIRKLNNNKMEQIKDLFLLFCETDGMRDFFEKPFTYKNLLCATDGKSFMYCKKSDLDFGFPEYQGDVDIDKAIREPNMSRGLDLSKANWEGLMTEEEMVGDGNDVECGHCHGHGSSDHDFSYKGRHYECSYECPVCEGTGYEQEEKMIPTGRMTFPEWMYLKIEDAAISLRLFYRVVQVGRVLNKPIELVYYSTPERGLTFQIGHISVLLMPALNIDDKKIVARAGAESK
jgi:hypothetical protein